MDRLGIAGGRFYIIYKDAGHRRNLRIWGIARHSAILHEIAFWLVIPTRSSHIGQIVPRTVKTSSWGINMGIILIPRVVRFPIVPVGIIIWPGSRTICSTAPKQGAGLGTRYPTP